ncbi:hypothetical protein O3P69_013491, partial [Scylla paramamosain]
NQRERKLLYGEYSSDICESTSLVRITTRIKAQKGEDKLLFSRIKAQKGKLSSNFGGKSSSSLSRVMTARRSMPVPKGTSISKNTRPKE